MKKTTRQQDIVGVARMIITSRGVKSLTVREIAKELGITDGALYRHFKNKNGIISLLIDDIEATLLGAIAQAVDEPRDPLAKLENVFFSHLSYTEQRRGVTFIVINEALGLGDKELRAKMYRVVEKYLETIGMILRAGIKSGIFRKSIDTESAAIAFFGMIQSAVTLWSLSGFGFSLRSKRLDKMFDIYKTAIIK